MQNGAKNHVGIGKEQDRETRSRVDYCIHMLLAMQKGLT